MQFERKNTIWFKYQILVINWSTTKKNMANNDRADRERGSDRINLTTSNYTLNIYIYRIITMFFYTVYSPTVSMTKPRISKKKNYKFKL